MTTPSLDELLKIAEAGELTRPVAKALVKVAMATRRYLLDEDASEKEVVANLEQAFADLATALKEGK